MTDQTLYAVFLHPGALEALGDAIKPYLTENALGPHVVCREIDSGGAFFEMLLEGTTADGKAVELELMVPSGMVRMVVSTHSDGQFGFHHRHSAEAVVLPTARATRAQSPTRDPLPDEPTDAPSAATRTDPLVEG